MGRPIKASYFGTPKGTGVGGEGVASVTVGGTNNSTGYTDGDAVTFSAPDVVGGVTATGTVNETAGVIDSITIVEAGSGYTSPPTVTAGTGTIGTTTLTAVLTTGTANAISVSAYLLAADGGSSAVAGDIVKQVGARRYKVTTAQGTGKVSLVTAAPGVGEMTITATDSAGGTYYVYKLEENTATLIRNSGTQFADNEQVAWTFDAAVLDTSVTIANV